MQNMLYTYDFIWYIVHFSLYLYCNGKTDMIMKTERICSWVLRISNPFTGKVEYRTRLYLTATEIEREAESLVSDNGNLYVSVFRLHKMF